MSEESIAVLQGRVAELEAFIETRTAEHEHHLHFVREEARTLHLHCNELNRMVDLYRWQYDHDTTPPLADQTQWKTGILKFDGEADHTRFFNPSLIRYKGKLLLATRRWRETPDSGINDIVIWEFHEEKPVNPRVVALPMPTRSEHYEDPRLMLANNKLHVSCCSFVIGSPAHQVVFELSDEFVATKTYHHNIGLNGPSLAEVVGHEKNWTWFEHDKELHLVYQTVPHVVHRISDGNSWETKHTNPLFRHGLIRGGTCPVRVGNEYFSFFHSSLPWKARKRRYFMGAYSFSAEAPFKITSMSTLPLLHGSMREPMNRDSPLVVFPGGAVLERGQWLVAYGINDNNCGWIKIPHKELLLTLRRT